MRNLNEIRHHIRAVEQTRKITNAMYLLSTSRMRRAMAHAAYNQEYYRRARASVKGIVQHASNIEHPYLIEHKRGGRPALVVIAGDKGMCGSYNETVLQFAHAQYQRFSKCYLVTIGMMATQYFQKLGITPDLEILGVAQNPRLTDARDLVEQLFTAYDSHVVDQVFLVSTRFINSLEQVPRRMRLLPLEVDDYSDVDAEVDVEEDVIFAPTAQQVLNTLVPQYAVGMVFGALVQAVASEHCARMNAMQQATKNADDMLKRLRAQYNTARQFAVTQEITEIAGAVNAMEGRRP